MVGTVLRKLLAEKGWSIQTLADKAGEPVETIKNIVYGRTINPHGDILVSISEALGVTVNYLYGRNYLTDDEHELINNFRECGVHGKNLLLIVADYEAHTAKSEREAKGQHPIPCILPSDIACEGMKYSSGGMKDVFTAEPDADLGLLVPNNNWLPRYCKGDVILLKRDPPKNGEEALFTQNGRVYFRKYIETEHDFILRCINNRHKDMVFKRMDAITCVGTAIGIIRA